MEQDLNNTIFRKKQAESLIGLFLLAFCCLLSQPLSAQQLADRTHSSMLGIGSKNQLDTYLSPLEYSGTEIRFVQDNLRATRFMKNRVAFQSLLQINGSYTKSPTDDGKYISGLVDWNVAWLYTWNVAEGLRILAGPQTGLHLGFIYNTRNGNNPAQARLSADIGATGMAVYDFHIKKQAFSLHYQANFPLAGLMFSPQYGQSYYEIFSLGHSDHNVCFTSPFSAVNFDQLLLLDVPTRSVTLRIGYEGCIRQSKVNEIKTHDWSHLFLIGIVKHFALIKNKKKAEDSGQSLKSQLPY